MDGGIAQPAALGSSTRSHLTNAQRRFLLVLVLVVLVFSEEVRGRGGGRESLPPFMRWLLGAEKRKRTRSRHALGQRTMPRLLQDVIGDLKRCEHDDQNFSWVCLRFASWLPSMSLEKGRATRPNPRARARLEIALNEIPSSTAWRFRAVTSSRGKSTVVRINTYSRIHIPVYF